MIDYKKYLQLSYSWNIEGYDNLKELIEVNCENEEEKSEIGGYFPIFCMRNGNDNDKNEPCNVKINTLAYTNNDVIKVSAVDIVYTARRMEVFGSKCEYILTQKGLCVDEVICSEDQNNKLPYSLYLIQHSFDRPCTEIMINLVSLLENNIIMIHKFIVTVVITPKTFDFASGNFTSILSEICSSHLSKNGRNQSIDSNVDTSKLSYLPNIMGLLKKNEQILTNNSAQKINNITSTESNIDDTNFSTSKCNLSENPVNNNPVIDNDSIKCNFCKNDIPCSKYEEYMMPQVIKHIQNSEARILDEIKNSENRILAKLNSLHLQITDN